MITILTASKTRNFKGDECLKTILVAVEILDLSNFYSILAPIPSRVVVRVIHEFSDLEKCTLNDI